MTKIMFVCTGNICRSCMAEFMFKNMVKKAGREEEFEIASAGTSREETGNDMYPPAKKILTEKGIPFEPRKARQITQEDMDHFDYIIAMDHSNIMALSNMFGEFSLDKVSLLMFYTIDPDDIADPWYTGDFKTCYADLKEGCEGLLDFIDNPPAEPEIPEYMQDPSVAQEMIDKLFGKM